MKNYKIKDKMSRVALFSLMHFFNFLFFSAEYAHYIIKSFIYGFQCDALFCPVRYYILLDITYKRGTEKT